MAAYDEYFYAQWGTATTIYFPLRDWHATNALPPDLVTGATQAAGDWLISIDGGAFANTNTTPTSEGSGWYSLPLTAAELQGTHILISGIDQTASKEWIDKTIHISTTLALGTLTVVPGTGNTAAVTFTGNGTGAGMVCTGGNTNPSYGLHVKAGTAGGAAFHVDGAASAGTNTSGATITGAGTSPGVNAVGGATGQAFRLTGGSTSGAGLRIIAGASGATALEVDAVAGNNNAASFQGRGTGHGAQLSGGATGDGLRLRGGSSSGSGLDSAAQAGNSSGALLTGAGTRAGLDLAGGTSGPGLYSAGGATTGAGAHFAALAGNNNGLTLNGFGSGSGLSSTAGATGSGIAAVGGATSGVGFNVAATAGNSNAAAFTGIGTGSGISASGGATGHGIAGTGGASSGKGFFNNATSTDDYNNFFAVTEGTEPSSAVANNATFGAILQRLKRRFFNKVTVTSTTLTTFKDDSSTAAGTQTVANDGTTQSVAKQA